MSLDKKLALLKILEVEVKEINGEYYVVSEEIEAKAKYQQVLLVDEDRQTKDEQLSEYYESKGLNVESIVQEEMYNTNGYNFEGGNYEVLDETSAKNYAIERITEYIEDELRSTVVQHYIDVDDIANAILQDDGYEGWLGHHIGSCDGYEIIEL